MSSLGFDIPTPLGDPVENWLEAGKPVVAKDAVETTVLVSINGWKRLSQSSAHAGTCNEMALGGEPLPGPRGQHDICIHPQRLVPRRLSVHLE
jgi:hypothetical protein